MPLRLHAHQLAGVRLALAILAAVAGISGACTTTPGSSGCAREQCDSSGNCINPQPALPLCTDNGTAGKTSSGGSAGVPEGGTGWGTAGQPSFAGNQSAGGFAAGGFPGVGGASSAGAASGGASGASGGNGQSGGSPVGGHAGSPQAGASSGGANPGAGGENGQGGEAGSGGDAGSGEAPSPLVISD